MSMKSLLFILYKSLRYTKRKLSSMYNKTYTRYLFYIMNVKHASFFTSGIPYLLVSGNGSIQFGQNFKMHNIHSANPIGRIQRCSFVAQKNGKIIIGDDVGISFTAIVAHKEVRIGNRVKIGGGTCIYDTDFHSLDKTIRADGISDKQMAKSAAINIKDNAFIGANSTILKGVTIGENSVIGACSVVTRSIPDNEIWAGNPANFIKTVN